ncbi:unnamed protein product [Closterium sp. NIES-64]|nr:unnamed protein product [Closterium sp. NIES-64]
MPHSETSSVSPSRVRSDIFSHHPLLPTTVLDMAQQQRERAQEREPFTSEMLAEQEETRKHEFESQPGEVKEAIAAAGGGSAVTPVTAPGGGGTEKGGAPGASSVEGASMGEEKPSATEKRAEVSKGEEGAASRETTKQGIHMPTTAAESMGGGVAAPEVPIRMRDVLPEGEVEGGALDMPVTKMDAAAKQREETAQFRGVC